FNWKKIILVGVILAVVFFSVGLWFVLRSPAPAPSVSPIVPASPSALITPSPSPPTPTPPSALFNMNKQVTIQLAATEDNLAGQKLGQQFSQSSEPAGSFIQIIFQITNGEESCAGLNRVISMLNLDFFNDPISLANATSSYQDAYLQGSQSFSLFVYTQALASASPFTGGQNEGRLGLIVKFKDSADLAGAIKDLKNLEPSLLKSAGALFLGKDINLSAADSFSDNIYQGIAIRYLNLPGPELSFDYAIVENTLLIATSKESMYAAIDRVLAK
ncbi:MAG: hypothetical protein LiPW39_615, partial [Parcubacteria group bacterium LiPW_39]